MCFMDWRIGRLLRSQMTKKSAAASQSIIIPPNLQRVGLTILGDATSLAVGFTVDDQNPATSQNTTALQFEALHLTTATHGDLPTRGMTVGSTGPNTYTGGYIEYFAPEWLIEKGMEQLYKDIGQPPPRGV